jgi:hypothetical protein
MGIVIFGKQQTAIDVDEFLVKCPCCETHSWADVMVLSIYYHIYWIPIFPFDKEANIICQTCGLKRFGVPFDAVLISNYNEVKGRFRHPWFTYTGVATLILLFAGVWLAALL